MSKTAPALPSLSHRSSDPRADGAVRTVELRDGTVIIQRVVGGVRMRVAVPVSSYRDLAIRIRMPSGSAELVLRHVDEDLNVVLSTGEADEIARLARDWSLSFGKAISVESAFVTVRGSFARRAVGSRVDDTDRLVKQSRIRVKDTRIVEPRVFSHEHEIIARS